MKTALKCIFCLVVLFGVTFGTFLWLPASMRYHITERYVLNAGEQQAKVYLGLLAPVSGSYQRVDNLKVDWQGEQQRETRPCVEMIKLSDELPPGSMRQVVVEYDVRVSYGLVFWIEEADECLLQSQAYIESDHPLIQEKASKITVGRSMLDAYRIYDFTAKYLTWSDANSDCIRGSTALEAYQSGTGSCGEFSRLMVAMCRAADIPSRDITGILLPDLEFPGAHRVGYREHPGEAHAWVEFSNGYVWTLADPAWGSGGWQIMQFARNDGRHLRYGGAELEGKVYLELRDWAAQQAPIAARRFSAMKYVLAVNSEGVRIMPEMTVRKVWDGRWLNTILVLAITTILLSYLRDRRFSNSRRTGSSDQEDIAVE